MMHMGQYKRKAPNVYFEKKEKKQATLYDVDISFFIIVMEIVSP